MKVGDMVRVREDMGLSWGGQYGYVHSIIPGTDYARVTMLSTGKCRYYTSRSVDNITEQADAVQDR